MDLTLTTVHVSCAPSPLWRRLPAVLLAVGLLASVAFMAASAHADVGVEKVSRSAGVPGDEVKLTVGCGFCFPPCYGPHGDRSGVCMPDTKALPPASFPISLVPIEKTPGPRPCGPNKLCSPQAAGPLRRSPFTFLGRATPPPDPTQKHIPRYLLHFDIPDLRPGVYSFVIYCESCLRGRGGSLIASRPW